MNLPKQLKIGGKTVKVLFPYTFTERSDLAAQAQYDPAEIRISDQDPSGVKFDEQSIVNSFIHEVLHHICDVYNGGEQPDETLIHALTQGILQILKDNEFLDIKEFFSRKSLTKKKR